MNSLVKISKLNFLCHVKKSKDGVAGIPYLFGGEHANVAKLSDNEDISYSIQYKLNGINRTRQAAANPRLVYYGGPVIPNVKVVTIWWGGESVRYKSHLEQFYSAVTKSDWYRIFAQYSTSNAIIGPGRWINSFNFSAAPRGTITDSQIRTSLRALIAKGMIPDTDGNTYYAIHFAPGINIAIGKDISCETYCAYHTTMWRYGDAGTFPYVYYGVIPDQGGGCSLGCGDNPIELNNLHSVASHELAEVVTDPAVGLSYYYSSPLAWYSTVGGEIADICNAHQGVTLGADGKVYVVQKQ